MSKHVRRWKRQPVKLSEKVTLRAAPADRLRGLELSEQLGVTEAEVARRAWLRGLEIIEKERS